MVIIHLLKRIMNIMSPLTADGAPLILWNFSASLILISPLKLIFWPIEGTWPHFWNRCFILFTSVNPFSISPNGKDTVWSIYRLITINTNGHISGLFSGELTIVPLPLILRPDLETTGFCSAERDESSFSTLQRSNFKHYLLTLKFELFKRVRQQPMCKWSPT